MSTTILSRIWFHKESKTMYLIPDEVEFLPGDYPIMRFDDAGKNVSKAPLSRYEITIVEAEKMLDEHYEITKKAVSQAVSANVRFKAFFLKEKNDSSSKASGSDPKSILGMNTEWMKEFMATMQNTDATEEQQKEAFKKIFSQAPSMSDFFDEETLTKAAENPEAWANEMREKMFGKEESEQREKDREKRNQEIRDQIRNNIKNAGNKD